MENFIVSARKYRPATFQSVVGQTALTTTLRNAIKSNHLAHAYLFCGPRGVGKTTCARIFAKTINCEHLNAEGEACNQCESCTSFNEQRSYNIHELDAASNNGVDDIRTLIDQVRIPPQIGRYSVYIIDEVHMLSPGAFNAFLKTLEEPPAHAIFILATTEKHKIIPTILSRCQIYDFNRITVSDTVNHLKFVAGKEGVSIEDNALTIIAQKSDGGMRDALSIFDQLVSFCGNNITYKGVIENLNVLDYEYYFRLVDAFLEGNVTSSLLIFNEILNKGFDAHHFVTGLSAHFRDILVSKDPQTIPLMEVGSELGQRYLQQATRCPVEFLYQALQTNNECDLNYRISNNKRLLVELTLIRLCQLADNKKKSLTETSRKAIQKIEVPKKVADKTKITDSHSAAPTKAKAIPSKPERDTEKVIQKPDVIPSNSTIQTSNRPVSISISPILQQQPQKPKPVETETEIDAPELFDEPYTESAFESTWRKFSQTTPGQVSIISYINNTLPVKIGEHTYELIFSNIFQQNEMLKLLPKLTAYFTEELKNSQIQFTTKIVENVEVDKSHTPEDILNRMTEQNPALALLKNKLKLEID